MPEHQPVNVEKDVPLAEQIRRELVCGCIEEEAAGTGKAHPFCRGAELAARLAEGSPQGTADRDAREPSETGTATSRGYCYACPTPIEVGDSWRRERVGNTVPHIHRLVHHPACPIPPARAVTTPEHCPKCGGVFVHDAACPLPPADLCHNGHPFVPGVSTDHAPGESDPRWCNTCGEARVLPPGQETPDDAAVEACAAWGCDGSGMSHQGTSYKSGYPEKQYAPCGRRCVLPPAATERGQS